MSYLLQLPLDRTNFEVGTNDTKIYSAMGLLCLVLLYTPHLFSFSFFVGFILLAATFYPSKAIMKRIEDDAFVEGLLKHRETIVKHYF